MNDTYVTFHGWVGAEVRHRNPRGTSIASLRVAVTPRLRRRTGEWVDGETTWYTVTAWRTLADHVRDSVRKGDAVIVHGRLRTETWRPSDGGPEQTTLHVEASFIGHDLSRGTSRFRKAVRPEQVEQEMESEVSEMIHEAHEDLTPMDSWGEPLTVQQQPPTAQDGSAA